MSELVSENDIPLFWNTHNLTNCYVKGKEGQDQALDNIGYCNTCINLHFNLG